MTKDSVDNKLLQKSIALSLDGVRLHGELCIPKKASNIVMFVHGSGSSRFSSRNRYVAEELNKHNQATLLFDLLSTEEESVEHHAMRRFDIRFLARRVAEVSKWLSDSADTRNLKLAYFGASTGAAAALVAAAALPEQVHAVVSRGGRPDLAGSALSDVQAPTLLIVGSLDTEVLELNRQAAKKLTCEHHLEIVPGASHLFEEPGTLEQVARLANDWFSKMVTP